MIPVEVKNICMTCLAENHPQNKYKCNICGGQLRIPDLSQAIKQFLCTLPLTDISISTCDGGTGYFVKFKNVYDTNLVGVLEALHERYGIYVYAINKYERINLNSNSYTAEMYFTTDKMRFRNRGSL